jgi:acyl-CoA thioester hydrolase
VYEHQTSIIVRYGETDQMGYVHHSNYAPYLEEARFDLFTSHGLDVVALEQEEIILPVVSMEIRYVLPLHFGDQITMKTRLKSDNKFKLELKYRILNQDQKLVAKANTALVFVERKSGKLIPEFHKYLDPLTLKEEMIS